MLRKDREITDLDADMSSINAASRKLKDSVAVVKSVDAALEEMQNKLDRMLELAVQAASHNSNTSIDRKSLDREFRNLKSEIDSIAESIDLVWRNVLKDKQE